MFQKKIGNSVFEISHKRMDRPDKSVYFNHIHDYCEILLFICGDADFNIDGQAFHPSPYDLIFIPPATYHCLLPMSQLPYENYVIDFKPDIIESRYYEKLFSSPMMINVKEDGEILDLFSRLDRYESRYDDEDFNVCTFALIKELMVCCAYSKGDAHSSKIASPTHIEGIINFISKNIEAPIDVGIISKHMHLSESYVQNLFSQNMHIGLKKYIMQKKIYAAHGDILDGVSPSRAGEKYGFGDYSSFYRLYKKTFGVSPRENAKS